MMMGMLEMVGMSGMSRMYGMSGMYGMSRHCQTPSVIHFWNHKLELIWMMGMLETLGNVHNAVLLTLVPLPKSP